MAQKVLIVEDDPSIISLMTDVLRLEGFDTTAVADGSAVLDTLRAEGFDVVLLDVMLPGMDGISILRAIREDPALASLPVVILTAKTDDVSTWEGWKAGCNYYIPKPFDPDELIAVLKRLESASPAAI
jgi:DNA-binding response OmpR family regulator